METYEIQQQFFNHLRSTLPPHISLVDEIGDLLNLSPDSVYRRVRGEKPLALAELKLICEKYHVSLDHVLQLQNDSVVFRAPDINRGNILFPDILKGYLAQLKYFNSFQKRQMLYLCKDLPIWHFYLFPEIAAFKTFFWIKTLINDSAYSDKLFSLSAYPFEDCFTLGQKVIREYNEIPCLELWNLESINSTMSQIEYYRDSGIFANNNDLNAVIESFDRTVEHLYQQAVKGVKFMPGDNEVAYRSPVQLYINEVVIGSNTILAEIENTKLSYITYNVFSFLVTKDDRFNDGAFQTFRNLVSRSTLISGTGEKERNRFFRTLREKVQALKK